MTPAMSRRAPTEAGFTLIEVMVAALILVTGVLGVVSLVDGANASTTRNQAREQGTNLSRQIIEAARGTPYSQLVTGTSLNAALQTASGLPDDNLAGTGWQIKKRNYVYSVTVTSCSVDDAHDGLGSHAGGNFCSDSSATGSADRAPDDYKRVGVQLDWNVGNKSYSVTQVGVIDNPGNAAGPSVASVDTIAPGPAGLAGASPAWYVSDDTQTVVTFKVTTNSKASTLDWSIDGVVQGTATPDATGKVFTVTWTISGVPDGSYLLGFSAYDSYGAQGPNRFQQVALNRFAPAAPQGFDAGRNGTSGGNSIVEFEWLPNSERDLKGYRVEYLNAGTWQSVCDVPPSQTSCRTTTAPLTGTLTYRAEAYDVDASNQPRYGAASSATVTEGNLQPYAATNVSVSRSGTTATVTLTIPTPQDPDGTNDAFIRIYRGGTNYTDRYDRIGASGAGTYTYTDRGANGDPYYVSLVDSQLFESPLVAAP